MVQRTLRFRSIPPEMQKLGQYLRRLRQELGWSIYEIAKKIETTPSYVSKLECGNILKSINAKTLVKLAQSYEVPITVILEECGLMERLQDDLPGIGLYLKLKYKFNHQAIKDMEIAREIIEKKYKIS